MPIVFCVYINLIGALLYIIVVIVQIVLVFRRLHRQVYLLVNFADETDGHIEKLMDEPWLTLHQ